MQRFHVAFLMMLFMGYSLAFAQPLEVSGVYGSGKNMLFLATGSPGELGLLEALAEAFNGQNDTSVHWVKAGSGASLKLLREKKVDLIMVHAPEDERKAIDEGWAAKRTLIGSNEFYIVGPPDDPAAISQATSAADAYARADEMRRTREVLARALQDNPQAGNPFLDLGFSLVRQGEFQAAGKAYVLAAHHGRTGDGAYKAAARACLFTRSPKRSARLLSEAVAQADASQHAYSVYKRIMGDIPRTASHVTENRSQDTSRSATPVNDIWAVVKFTAKAFLGGGSMPFEPLPLDF